MARPVNLRKINAALNDPHLLYVPLEYVQRKYRMNFATAKRVRARRETLAREAGQWTAVERERLRDRLIEAMYTAEERYPGIVAQCVRGKDYRLISKKFMSSYRPTQPLTRERVRQIAQQLTKLSRMLHVNRATVAIEAAQRKLPLTHKQLWTRTTP